MKTKQTLKILGIFFGVSLITGTLVHADKLNINKKTDSKRLKKDIKQKYESSKAIKNKSNKCGSANDIKRAIIKSDLDKNK